MMEVLESGGDTAGAVDVVASTRSIGTAGDGEDLEGSMMSAKAPISTITATPPSASPSSSTNGQCDQGKAKNGQVVDLNQNCSGSVTASTGSNGVVAGSDGVDGGKHLKAGKNGELPVAPSSSDASPSDVAKKRDWMEKLLKDSTEGGPDHKPTEQDLLKKLEEANRLLEADTKFPSLAACSSTPSHSRKSSGSSIISSNSTNSHYSCQTSNESNDDPNNSSADVFLSQQKQPSVTRSSSSSSSSSPFKKWKKNEKSGRILSTASTSSTSPSSTTDRSSISSPPSTPSSPTKKSAPRPPLTKSASVGSALSSSSSLSLPTLDVIDKKMVSSPPASLPLLKLGVVGQEIADLQQQQMDNDKTTTPTSPAGSTPTTYTSSIPYLTLESVLQINVTGINSSESLWEIWGRIINDWESVRKKPAFLKDLVRKGIPHEFRGMAWQLILGVHDAVWKQEYAEHMKKTSPCEKLIRRDIARTFPDHDFFKEKDGFGQESLFNVMKAYSLHDREVGYCQGSGFIVGMLLMQMPEEDAFAVLVRLMQDFRLRELFKPSMAELGLCMFKLECLIQELLPTLLVHFQTQNFDTSMYASSWFLTLYVTSLPLSLARRIMDLFVSEGMEIIFRVGVAILQSCQEDLLALDMEGLLMYLQKDLRNRFEQETDQDNLMQTAFGVKYSHKRMKKLEKEYTALKTKENEDQIELRRLRTENRLLRQRIENLEKSEAKLLRQTEESATLADHLVQDQVTRAQEAEEVYALRNELSVTKQQLRDTQSKLMDSQDIIGDIKKRTRIIEDAVYLDQGEEQNMVKHLQEELIAVRLRETETADIIKGLKVKITDLEDTNQRLQRAPSNDVQQLQEELIAVKLREAEANLALKELKMKVNEIEKYWEAHMERIRQSSPKDKGSKSELRQLQEEVMTLKTKEAKALIEVKEVKQKLMEMETQNHIVTNQIRRMGEDNKDTKRLLEEAEEREKDLKTNLKDLTRKLDDTESQRKEEGMMSRIQEAESVQQMAELRHKIAQLDIQKEELLAACKLLDKTGSQELENRVFDLQDEILKVKMTAARNKFKAGGSLMTDSFMGNNSDEEVDAEINDSKNLDKTLSDIIEGRSPSKYDSLVAAASDDIFCDRNGKTSGSIEALLEGRENKKWLQDCNDDKSSRLSRNKDIDDDDEDGNGDNDNVVPSSLSSSTPISSSKGAKHLFSTKALDSESNSAQRNISTTVINKDDCDDDDDNNDDVSSSLDDDSINNQQQKSDLKDEEDDKGKNDKSQVLNNAIGGDKDSCFGDGGSGFVSGSGGCGGGSDDNNTGKNDKDEGSIGVSTSGSCSKGGGVEVNAPESLANVGNENSRDDRGGVKTSGLDVNEAKQRLIERWELYDEDDHYDDGNKDSGPGVDARNVVDDDKGCSPTVTSASTKPNVGKDRGGKKALKGLGKGGSVVVIPKSTPSECGGDLSQGFVHGYHSSQRSKSSALLPRGIMPKSGKVVVIRQEGKRKSGKMMKDGGEGDERSNDNRDRGMKDGESLKGNWNVVGLNPHAVDGSDDIGDDAQDAGSAWGDFKSAEVCGVEKKKEEEGDGSKSSSIEKIPDIEVIYEPSCFKRKLSGCVSNTCLSGEEGGSDEAAFLKESSV